MFFFPFTTVKKYDRFVGQRRQIELQTAEHKKAYTAVVKVSL